MDYRGIVQGGVIVLDAGLHLPEGQEVDVVPRLRPTDLEKELPGAGLWRDRTDLGDTADAAEELRRTTNRRNQ